MMLNNRLMIPSALLLLVCHMTILYYWIFDWQKITTPYGLFIWIGSTICGCLLYYHFKNQKSNRKILIGSSIFLIVSSSFMIFLGIVTGVTFIIVSSMP
ncbi:hypothetical protein [Bacillus sp. SH5-2]|uniref:hypothetical protein n=1 Tax=Bacillus sp. SH5-2 TaxID=2217834 RepID=UPI0011EF64D7|nr:hypothetical protein [Bacillus sp. SH5-2]KAA0765765.1 hypothetical protein DN410_05690 [Bacillus sp. SH5-2]